MRSGDRARVYAATPDRRALVAKIHIARKQLAMEEASYRALLLRVTGQESLTACAPGALVAVIEEFKRLGFAASEKRRSDKPHVRKVYALWGALKPHLANPSEEALRAFVWRQTEVRAPEWLDARQANKVIEGLKAWLRRVGAEAPAEPGEAP